MTGREADRRTGSVPARGDGYRPVPDRARRGLLGPSPGTVVLGLAVVTLGVAAMVQTLTGYSPDPRYAAATMLAAFGALSVLTSVIGLWLERRRDTPPGD